MEQMYTFVFHFPRFCLEGFQLGRNWRFCLEVKNWKFPTPNVNSVLVCKRVYIEVKWKP